MEEIEKTRLIILKQLKSKCPFVIWDIESCSHFWERYNDVDILGGKYFQFEVSAQCNGLHVKCNLGFSLYPSEHWKKYNRKEISRITSKIIKDLKKKVKQ